MSDNFYSEEMAKSYINCENYMIKVVIELQYI